MGAISAVDVLIKLANVYTIAQARYRQARKRRSGVTSFYRSVLVLADAMLMDGAWVLAQVTEGRGSAIVRDMRALDKPHVLAQYVQQIERCAHLLPCERFDAAWQCCVVLLNAARALEGEGVAAGSLAGGRQR